MIDEPARTNGRDRSWESLRISRDPIPHKRKSIVHPGRFPSLTTSVGASIDGRARPVLTPGTSHLGVVVLTVSVGKVTAEVCLSFR